jgi:hypothetical protein
MAATQIFVLPTAVLGVGVHGPFVGPEMAAEYSGYEFQVTPGPGWPSSGGPVLELTVEVSHDGGLTWTEDASCDMGPTGQWANPASGSLRVAVGAIANQTLTCAATDLYRFTLNVLQAIGAPTFTVLGVP